MGFDLEGLRSAVAQHGPVTRVVIAAIKGSSPREAGAAMLVWAGGQAGTIGGGALEFEATEAAQRGQTGLSHHALGPELGQCCGGAVTLLSETYDAARLDALAADVVARPVTEGTPMPMALHRLLALARSQGKALATQLLQGWMIEPVHRPTRSLWIWGAGHVGRALVDVLSPLPDLALTWIDTGPERFPNTVPDAVTILPAANPADLVRFAPAQAEHLILTYSHALDLELCHRLLGHGFRACGLIGSATKKARFRKRLAALGHGPAQIERIACPIGDPALGKHPQMIAVGVAAALLKPAVASASHKDLRA